MATVKQNKRQQSKSSTRRPSNAWRVMVPVPAATNGQQKHQIRKNAARTVCESIEIMRHASALPPPLLARRASQVEYYNNVA
jgi:hypothetical protein